MFCVRDGVEVVVEVRSATRLLFSGVACIIFMHAAGDYPFFSSKSRECEECRECGRVASRNLVVDASGHQFGGGISPHHGPAIRQASECQLHVAQTLYASTLPHESQLSLVSSTHRQPSLSHVSSDVLPASEDRTF